MIQDSVEGDTTSLLRKLEAKLIDVVFVTDPVLTTGADTRQLGQPLFVIQQGRFGAKRNFPSSARDGSDIGTEAMMMALMPNLNIAKSEWVLDRITENQSL